MLRRFTACLFAVLPGPAFACRTALLLAIDVSNSIDSREFLIQTEGLAMALRDPDIVEELVAGQVNLAVMQWSGKGEQALSIPWQSMASRDAVELFARAAADLPRAFIGSDTALGEAVTAGLGYLSLPNDCQKLTMDVSGDGQDNAGSDPHRARQTAERLGVTINGLAIESGGLAVTRYYQNYLRTRDGFVMTAPGHHDYAETLRKKILREIEQVLF